MVQKMTKILILLCLTANTFAFSSDADGQDLESIDPKDIDIKLWKLKKCKHIFHPKCIADWYLSEHKTSPLCRKNMEHGEY